LNEPLQLTAPAIVPQVHILSHVGVSNGPERDNLLDLLERNATPLLDSKGQSVGSKTDTSAHCLI
jgi:hypothetical protein